LYTATTKIELPGIRGEDGEYSTEPRLLEEGETISKKDLSSHQSDDDIGALVEAGALEES
jgi:hypothetical protein